MSFDRISEQEGLLKRTITCILQDRKGFMWFGSEDGLLKYDGHSFQEFIYNPDDPGSLSSNLVYALLEDRHGRIWIGTVGGGLNRLEPDTGVFTRFQHDPSNPGSLSHNGVISLLEDSKGRLWIGTEGGGLNRLEPDSQHFIHYLHDPENSASISFNSMWHLYEDEQGKIWIGTHGGGLNILDPDTNVIRIFHHNPEDRHSLASDTVGPIFKDSRRNIWVGGINGLNRMDLEKGTFTRYQHDPNDPHSIGHNHVWSIHEDKKGFIWIGSFGGGLSRFDPDTGRFRSFRHDPSNPKSLSSDLVWRVYEGRDEVIWIATDGGGLNRFISRTAQFNHVSFAAGDKNDGLLYPGINGITGDSDGILWLANDGGGFQRYDPLKNNAKLYRHKPGRSNSLNSDLTESILVDHRNIVWIGTYNGGLNSYNPETGRFKHYLPDSKNPESLSDNRVWTLFEDDTHHLWVGTRGGLNRLSPDRSSFTQYLHDPSDPSSISDNGIWAVLEDSDGTLWVGTDNGLNRMLKNGGFRRYISEFGNPNSLSHNNITALHETSDGILWVGTNGGLNRMDRRTGRISRYTVNEGMQSNSVRGILEDQTGHLWITTLSGVSRFLTVSGQFRNYGVLDGLQGSEFSRAHYQTPDGKIVVGGRNGINIFDPLEIQDNPHIPPVAVTGFQITGREMVDGRRLNPDNKLILDYKDTSITFEFAALDYNNPKANGFAYKLEGFDKNWIYPGKRRNATYTNLDGGQYVFRVKGSNNHGVWNHDGVGIHLEMGYPPWQRWWAYLIYIFTAIFLVYGIVELRSRHHKQKIAAVERINSELELEIAERKRIQTALGLSEQRLNFAIAAAKAGIWDYYPQTEQAYFNHTWFTMLGYSPEELPSSYGTWIQLLHPDDKSRMLEHWERFAGQGEEEFHTEFRLLAKDQTWRWILAVGKVYERNTRGDIVRISGIHFDITDRKLAENNLKISEERYRNYFEDDLSGTYIASPEGRLIACNYEYKRIFGFQSTRQAMDTPVNEIFKTPDDRIEFLRRIEREKRINNHTATYRRVDGTLIDVLENASGVFDEHGHLVHIRGFLSDITEQRKLETKLMQAQKMEAIGTLAGGIAHDFNNILSGILGYCQLSLLDVENGVKITKYISQIESGAQRAAELVRQILTYSRRSDYNKYPLDIHVAVKEALKLMRSTIPATIDIRENFNSEATVLADPLSVHQLIMNLCTNAYHAMGETGGTLTISLENTEITSEKHMIDETIHPGVYISLEVSDTGIGMDKETLEKAFDPYFTTKQISVGTGLGLALVEAIVKEHKGFLEVFSKPGEGTNFFIYLPVYESEKNSAPVLQEEPSSINGTERIMIVDDEAQIRNSITLFLKKHGYVISTFENAVEALNEFQKKPDRFDLVITDMAMPKMAGDRFAAELLKIRPDLPILLCTGYSESMSNEKAASIGIKRLLYKPVDFKKLGKLIRDIMEEIHLDGSAPTSGPRRET